MEKMDNKPKTFLQSINDFYSLVRGYVKQRSFKDWIEYAKKSFNDYVEELKVKTKDLKKTNFELALFHLYKGNLSDARFRFRLVNRFWKDMIECDYFIGRTFYLEKAFKKARNYFETYLATGDQRYVEEAKYCLDVIDQRTDSITKIPLKIIQESYNVYADFYNKIIEANIQNSPQHKLSQLIIKYLNEISKSPINKGVDLGCGTGLVGKQIKATKGINYLIGVDIAERMLEEAKILKEGTELVYNETIHLDVDEYIAQTLKKEKFDIFIACSLLNYYSEVKKLFENCAKLAKPGALLCFTFRTHEQSTLGLFNGNIEEFSYSPALLKKLLLDLGWKLTDEGEIKLLDGGSGMYIISQHK